MEKLAWHVIKLPFVRLDIGWIYIVMAAFTRRVFRSALDDRIVLRLRRWLLEDENCSMKLDPSSRWKPSILKKTAVCPKA
jgi:hypothetical protein